MGTMSLKALPVFQVSDVLCYKQIPIMYFDTLLFYMVTYSTYIIDNHFKNVLSFNYGKILAS